MVCMLKITSIVSILAEVVAHIEYREADCLDEAGGECHHEPARALCTEDYQLAT